MSIDLKHQPAGFYLLKAFDMQAGATGAPGSISAGSTIAFTLWMRKAASAGTMFPQATLTLNSGSGPLVCTARGTTALTTSLSAYAVTCDTGTAVSLTSTDRFYLAVGVNVTVAASGAGTRVELYLEGVLNANYDSRVAVPLPVPSVSARAIGGTVVRVSDGAPIAGAAISVYAGSNRVATATTNSGGGYTTGLVLPGAYDVEAVAAGSRTAEQVVVVVGSSDSYANFKLEDAARDPVLYAYDPLGRLIQVTDPSGDFAVYRYDAVGNILGIDRRFQDELAISGFSPASGPAGTRVSIFGGGFADSAGANIVTVNGAAAAVESAMPTCLVAVVPAGATTGPIRVTTSTASVATAASFVVSSSNGRPVISGFSPTIGVAGTPVSITGSNFDPTPVNNRVDLNGRITAVAAANATNLSTSVPSFALGGPISITTAFGTATSAADFFVVPAPGVPADVVVADRLVLGTNKTITIATANKIALLLFDGVSGQRASFNVTSSTIGTGAISVFRPDGVELFTNFSTSTNAFIDGQTLPMTGTYTVRIAPSLGATGSLTILGSGFNDVAGPISMQGIGVPVTIASPGQNAQLTFVGTAGQLVSATATSSVWGSCGFGGQYNLAILKPDGSTLATVGNACGPTTVVEHQILPTSGTYTLLLDPLGNRTGTATLAVHAFNDVAGPVPADGTPVPVNITVPGQLGSLTFTGVAGRAISALSTSDSWQSCAFGGMYSFGILKPDGSWLVNYGNGCGPNTFIDRQVLPAAGTYTLRIDPLGALTGTTAVRLYDVVDINAPITVNGPAVPVTVATPGQNALLTFSGTAGQAVTARATSSVWVACGWTQFTLSIVKPDGSTLGSVGSGCGQALVQRTLPVDGVYTIRLDPVDYGTGTASVSLTSP